MGVARERLRGYFFRSRIPLWIKVFYTLFVAVFVVVVAQEPTPIRLLWFCNVAVLTALVALWLENSLLASMVALAIFWPHVVWQLDLLVQLPTGIKLFGPGIADYILNPKTPLVNRLLNGQHAWMLYLLFFVLWRLGYDRRALPVQTVCAWVILSLSYALTTDIHEPAGNLNRVYGPWDREPQTWMGPWVWVAFLMVFIPVCHYAPLHFLFRRIFRVAKVGPCTG